MIYHCGLLSEVPNKDRTLQWIKGNTWGRMPPEVELELDIWLATPGFTLQYHAHALGRSTAYVRRRAGNFDEHKDRVIENWLSATRDDCVRLARLRKGSGAVPLICQLRAVDDLKHMKMVDVARDYRVTAQTLINWRWRGCTRTGFVPYGFEWLVRS